MNARQLFKTMDYIPPTLVLLYILHQDQFWKFSAILRLRPGFEEQWVFREENWPMGTSHIRLAELGQELQDRQ